LSARPSSPAQPAVDARLVTQFSYLSDLLIADCIH